MRLYTSYFAAQKKMPLEDAAYVSIAVGNPKYSVPYEIVNAKIIKPYGVFGKYHGEAYEQKYFERLDSYGVPAILNELDAVAGDHENVILMCHERDPETCHRRMFAKWWFEKTGEIIPEIDATGKEKNIDIY